MEEDIALFYYIGKTGVLYDELFDEIKKKLKKTKLPFNIRLKGLVFNIKNNLFYYNCFVNDKNYCIYKTSRLIHFKGENSNEQLIAIDGFAFDNAKDLETFKAELQDRAERDHRKIGANLELFCFSDKIGQGLPIWLDNGTNIKFEIENYCKELMQKNEYHFVQTPVLGTTELYKISGHWDHYRENMFTPFKVENEEFVLKPMNCPHHIIVYIQKPHSYQELPYRIAEFGIQHRYESSGSLTGLERVRQMQLVDTHTVLMHEQIKDEIKKVYSMILEAHKTLGTSIYSLELSLHDPKDKAKFFDNDKMWANAEKQLREALKSLKVPFKEVIGEAAFYGPKIDMQMKTALGHIVTISTIQLDFLLPERFNLEYIDSEGKKARPVFIHAGIIGTFERYLAILLEQTKGILPFWLSPNQVIFLPVLINIKKEIILLPIILKDHGFSTSTYLEPIT